MEQTKQHQSDSDDSFEGFQVFDEKAKEEEIASYYCKNYEKVIETFQNYSEQRTKMKALNQKMGQFEAKIDKIKKSNTYDIREINSKTNTLVNIAKVVSILMEVKSNINLAQKAVSAIKIEKYTTSIRHFQKIRAQNQPAEDFFASINQLLIKKVQTEADKKIHSWAESLQEQQVQMGRVVLQNCESLLGSNQAFGRVSLFQPDTRSSIIMRNSLIQPNQRQSIVRQSLVKQSARLSTVGNVQERASIFRQFQVGASNEPLQQGLSREPSQRINVSMMQEPLSQPEIWEFAVDFSQLKQPQLFYENLNQKMMFFQMLKKYRLAFLHYICSNKTKQAIADIRTYLCGILGFILMDTELNKSFREYEEMNSVVLENYNLIEQQIKMFFKKVHLGELLLLKKELSLFSLALAKLKLYQLSNAINKTLNEQFIVFSNRRIESISQFWLKSIKEDRGDPLCLESKELFDSICQILKITGTVNARSKKFELSVSSFAQDVLSQINLFIEGSIQYLSNLNEYFDQNVIFCIDTLFLQLCDVVKNFIQGNEDFNLIIQQTFNFNALENSISYYKRYIQSLLQVTSTKDFECQSHFKNTRYFCEEALQNAINSKLVIEPLDWCPSTPNKGPHDQFIILIATYESMKATLSAFVPDFVESSVYLTFKQINTMIWKQLLSVKNFNILGLVNIELDLKSLLQMCGINQFPESIKEFTQFIQLFLYEPVLSYLDVNKRQQSFNYLNGEKLLKVLPKYKKIVYGKYPQVRKRDVDQIVKRIQENPGSF